MTKIPVFGVLDEKELQLASSYFTLKRYDSDDTIHASGWTCRYLFFVVRGSVYAVAGDDTERILWYEFENSSFTDILSFYSQKPGNCTIKAAEDKTALIRISHEQLNLLYNLYHSWAKWGVKFYEAELTRLTRYYENLRTKDASERYFELVEANPEILQRVSLGHIASYLGISQVSLSRIRAGTQKK